MVLFTRPVVFESVKPYPYGGGRPSSSAAFHGILDDILNPVSKAVSDVVDTLTGQRAQREARQQSLELAKLQAEAQIQSAQVRAATWQSAVPWIGVGVAALGLVGGLMLLKGSK